jgi:hypothetical protein
MLKLRKKYEKIIEELINIGRNLSNAKITEQTESYNMEYENNHNNITVQI